MYDAALILSNMNVIQNIEHKQQNIQNTKN